MAKDIIQFLPGYSASISLFNRADLNGIKLQQLFPVIPDQQLIIFHHEISILEIGKSIQQCVIMMESLKAMEDQLVCCVTSPCWILLTKLVNYFFSIGCMMFEKRIPGIDI